ncbi:hypothetical protein O0I10_009012 [Lichtheimia ornata]|uniref:RING-type E3 ubiquitin transferase n=1 Tax=Lichtheimia ornata TaxID=688661 RepID=A0AAD7UX80_9FUNG|nr:uncharacterized protein O0I10_009012 [Lichtheimia ornata]KAJ8655323.1 hypothetical protein O0I10_009012 [Lichtheimia ornata]
MESTDSVSRNHDTTEIETNDTVNDMPSPTTETITHHEPSEDDMPQQLLPERKRQQFSYTANELRRRHIKNEEKMDNSGSGFYECNICFDTATHPVLTLCGHLFCWSCLAQWLNAQSRNPTCPVCKAGCGKDKVIPVYGRGREEKDPRNDPSIPTRPAGQRPPPLRDPNTPGSSFFGQPFRGMHTGNNIAISAGIGLFPFGIAFNIPTSNAGIHGQPGQNSFMSRLILMVIILLLAAIIFY